MAISTFEQLHCELIYESSTQNMSQYTIQIDLRKYNYIIVEWTYNYNGVQIIPILPPGSIHNFQLYFKYADNAAAGVVYERFRTCTIAADRQSITVAADCVYRYYNGGTNVSDGDITKIYGINI